MVRQYFVAALFRELTDSSLRSQKQHCQHIQTIPRRWQVHDFIQGAGS